MDRIRRIDVEAVAGLIAAVAALVLHLLHIVEPDVLLVIILVILALMMVRDLRREDHDEHIRQAVDHTDQVVRRISDALTPPDTTLVGPASLREVSARFSADAAGEMLWFNVCLSMFEPQALFDALLRPAIENPRVTAVQFVLDEGERDRWEQAVLPKARALDASQKLVEPAWTTLQEPVSCILAANQRTGRTEALLSFWGDPFMARQRDRDVPRYIFHVHDHSELITQLAEVVRGYRIAR